MKINVLIMKEINIIMKVILLVMVICVIMKYINNNIINEIVILICINVY